MAIKDKWNKVKEFFIKNGKKNLIIVCAVALIGAAVGVNWALFADNGKDDGFNYGNSTGMSGELDNTNYPTSGDGEEQTAVSDSYFATVQVSRQRARDEALEVLNAVVDNANATEEVKAEAVAEIAQISLEMQYESDIESMLISKGFEQCVAVVNGDSASIVVKCEGMLTQAQLAQINGVVFEQAGIEPINITIVGRE